jgi:ABC-type bacteriocin/lantibiotic exporter with double-glycine peptidase domain
MKQTKTNYEELKTGEITMHLHKLPTVLYSYIEDMRDMIIPQFLVYAAAIVYFGYYDKRISFALIGIIVLLLMYVKYTIDKCADVSEKRDNQYNIMMEEITDVMKNITAVLNANTEQKVVEAFDRLLPEKTLIIITHKHSTIKNCDLIYEFKNGELFDITSEQKYKNIT